MVLRVVSCAVLSMCVSAKEFADCGSSALVPALLELSPDPAEASQPLEFIVTMEAKEMVTGGMVHATITSTRNKDITATTTTNLCFLGERCPIVSGPAEFEINAPIR